MAKVNKRNSVADFWRVVAAINIVLYHSYLLGYDDYYCFYGWIYVEFFLIMTGFFTTAHFSDLASQDISLDVIAVKSVNYTIRKFAGLIPYVAFSIAMVIFYSFFCAKEIGLKVIVRSIMEMSLIPSNSSNGVLWYLSAVLLVFPLFCCILQARARMLINIIMYMYVIIYIRAFGMSGMVLFPYNILRVINGLFLGALSWQLADLLRKRYMDTQKWLIKLLLTEVEIVSMLCVLYISCLNKSHFEFALLCEFVGISLMLSGITLTSLLTIPKSYYFEKLSMVVFLIHSPIASILHFYNINSRVVLIIVSTVGAIILNCFFGYFINRHSIKRI